MNDINHNLELLDGLNEIQREAVLHESGPLLIFAGAGSGKTRVITHRIAYLCREKKIYPWQIAAVTFTNRAAEEMRSRLKNLMEFDSHEVIVKTFHSLGLYILSRHASEAGLSSNFSVYDDSAQKSLLKAILKDKNIDPQMISVENVQHFINRSRDAFENPDEVQNSSGFYEKEFSEIYRMYLQKLKENNAVDFAGLLYEAVLLLKNNPAILSLYQNLWKYFLIDEYQDTNHTQYMLGHLLARSHGNISVVGDDDQSIYSWRGANINNILNFEQDYPGCKILRLEENYRSTKYILGAASSLIHKNEKRSKKTLFTVKKGGDKIIFTQCSGDIEEVRLILDRIQTLKSKGFSYDDMAVLYRTNAQSRLFEQIFVEEGIPTHIIGAFRFYERKEIKDILSYLAAVVNPQDTVSLERIVNVPPRGAGEAALSKLHGYAFENQISFFEALGHASKIKNLRGSKKIEELHSLLVQERSNSQNGGMPTRTVKTILDKSGYNDMLNKDRTPESATRKDNLNEFINAVKEYEDRTVESGDVPDLGGYLQSISLMTQGTEVKSEEGRVSLMTLHNAKGLEYPVVFITGMEEGYIPHMMSIEEGMLEEERRLLYVGITRARENLFLSSSRYRRIFGTMQPRMPSRFLDEIDPEVMEMNSTDSWMETPRAADHSPRKTPPAFEDTGIIYEKKDRVFHEKYGSGTVQDTENTVSGQKIGVRFDQDGSLRKFLTVYTPLRKIIDE